MDRTFQSKVDKWYWMILAISSLFLFYCFWVHLVLLALLGGLVVVFEIEMVVHTRYVVMPKNVSDFIRCLSKHSPGIRIIPDESKN